MVQSSPPDDKTLFESLPDPVLVVDVSDYRVVRRNKAAEEVYGPASGSAVTCHSLTHGRSTPCREPASSCPLPEVVASDQLCTKEHVHQGRWGHSRYFLVQTAPLRDSQGTIRWVTESHTEITAQKADLVTQATHDPVTGGFNRYHFEQVLEHEIERAQRFGTPFSLIMLDIDHFKSVNDRFGHATGDQVLLTLANLIKERLRGVDILARWGGEEFMIVLPETPRDGAEKVGEVLRWAVAEKAFPGPDQITVSAGAAAYRSGESQRVLLKRVDDALYRAKNGGRNRVAVDGDSSKTD